MYNNNRGLRVKDLISIGLYTAFYFAMILVSNLIIVFLIPGYSYIYIPVVVALLSGLPFMLLYAKVPRFGAITIMGAVPGIFQTIMGLSSWAFIYGIIVGLLADLIAQQVKHKNKKGALASYTVFSFNSVAPTLPMFFTPDVYVEQLISDGRDADYIASAFENISQTTFWLLVIGIIIAALIGGYFGQKMLKKHFEKAGIV